jgi:hypothetical protein
VGVKGRLRVAVAGLGLAFVLAIALGATGVLAPKNQRVAFGASTTLTIITAPVLVRHAGGDFSTADDGSILGPGDTVQTGDGGRAVLTYFEGSTVEIEPASQLTITTAHANPDGSTVVVMQQDIGTTWHVVQHLITGGSKYEVHTTAATASVRGTQFTVGVDPDGTTTETTTEGVVANSDSQGNSTVVTPPGLQTTTHRGENPAPPQQAPEPNRKVDVVVGDQNTLVVDTFGRANGIKDGKKVLQTPGAQLEIVDGKLVIHLPGLPDGTLTTHFLGTSGSTDVTTTVKEKGKLPVTVTDNVQAGTNSGVDIKKGDGSNAPSLEKKNDKKDAPSPKVGEVPPAPTEGPVPTDNANTAGGPANPPPGQQLVPPGQQLVPPGQQLQPPANPSAPGQLQTPPGQLQTPPGQLKTPPGQQKPGGFVPPPLDIGAPQPGGDKQTGADKSGADKPGADKPDPAKPEPPGKEKEKEPPKK